MPGSPKHQRQQYSVHKAELCQCGLLGAFLDAYFEKRTDVKAGTRLVWSHAKRNLLEYFDADKPLQEVTAGDAEDFRRWLLSDDGQALHETTTGKRLQVVRQFFEDAFKHELIPRNPFANVKAGNIANRTRDYYLPHTDAAKVLSACPDAEWRLIFALSRFAGFRCPSEHLALRWTDINWETNRITLDAPKTGVRVLPVFEGVRGYLEDARELAGNSEYVINRNRRPNANLRTTFTKIIKRAGLEPWPKLFHNLRASCQTDLQETYPGHVVCGWLGNSEAIAAKHYLQTTDDHFNQASGGTVQKAVHSDNPTAENKGHAVQKAVHSMPETGGNSRKDPQPQNNKTPVLQGFASTCGDNGNASVAEKGFEVCVKYRGKTYVLAMAGDSRGIIEENAKGL